MVYVFTRVLRFPDNTIIALIKDNYHEQGNIIIILLLLPLGHISNITLHDGVSTLFIDHCDSQASLSFGIEWEIQIEALSKRSE